MRILLMRIYSAAALLALLALPGAHAATLIHAGALIDGRADRAGGPATIVVQDGRITAVERGHRAPGEGDELIDLSASTVLPGLMDMHTHLTSEIGPDSYIVRFTHGAPQITLQSTVYARRTLDAGFTTVRDLGDRHNISVALRDAIARGEVAGPRIFTSGKSIATTGGHADPTNGWAAHIAGDPGPADGVVNGIADARKAVRQRYKDGVDLIKVTATGGVLSLASSGENPQFAQDELEAVVATAHDYDFHVAAHAHGAEGMKRAIRAGVHSIEHGTYMDDEVIRLMKEHGTWYVATIFAGRFVGEKAQEPDYFPAIVRPKAAAIGPQIQQTFARAHEAGVNIVFGTDCGVGPHGENAREFEFMVEGGMAPMDAIRAATSVAAKFLGVEDRLGTIEPGKLADIIAVEGDPLADVGRLQAVHFVMKEGVVYRSAGTAGLSE
ncbi:MAG TPA: amidohydrolase family protein [Gammaproteobacteria bacterium]|nr:amidohydrolase family protein [Gammaproteobacteria bacterium]